MKSRNSLKILKFILPLVLSTTGATSARADNAIWELALKDNKPTDCRLSFTHVARGGDGQPYFDADSRQDDTAWHSCIVLPNTMLKVGQGYTVNLDYIIGPEPAADCYFYIFARSEKLGYGADTWQKWTGKADTHGKAKLSFTAKADDVQITVGIHNKGAIHFHNLKVTAGDGLTNVLVNESIGKVASIPTIAVTAQSFVVEPPNNLQATTLNLKDFGAVADGEQSAKSGPDLNLAAFKKAIAKCHEIQAAKLIVPKGVYRINAEEPILFDGLNDFCFDGGGSTFLYNTTKGGAAIKIARCTRTVFSNFNIDWDWQQEPLASIGRIKAVASDASSFDMQFERRPPLQAKQWLSMNPLDEKLRAPGVGQEYGGFNVSKIEALDPQTVRVWMKDPIKPPVGKLYLLRHYDYNRHCILMDSNAHLSLQNVTVFSFPGMGFVVGGDQHHYELLKCRITHPDNDHRPITTTADGLHIGQSKGYLRLENCDFGYMGDDCVNIHDVVHAGVRRVDDHTLVATKLVLWRCPFAVGDPVEIRHADFSPTEFTGKLTNVQSDYKAMEVTMTFDQSLPAQIDSRAILFNHRYGTRNFIIRNCYFHENRARALLCNTADGLVENNRFFHNQHAAMLLLADIDPHWSEGFGARNIVVRNNRFEDANAAGIFESSQVCVFAKVDGQICKYPVNQNILFDSNTFSQMSGPAIWAESFKNLVITRNNFTETELSNNAAISSDTAHLDKLPPALRGSIHAQNGSGLTVVNNIWKTEAANTQVGVVFDLETIKDILVRENN